MSQKLESSLKKIEKVFYRAKLHGSTRSEKKMKNERSNSDSTYDSYAEKVKSFMRYCNKEYGISDVSKIDQEMVENFIYERVIKYQEGHLSEANNIHSYINSIESFRQFSTETKVFKRDLKIDDLSDLKDELNELKVKRIIAASTRMQSTRSEAESVIENLEKNMYNTKNKQEVLKSANIAMRYGARARAILRLTKNDIDLDKKTITFRNDKGKKTRIVRINNEKDLEYARNLVAGATKEGKIVQFTKKNGDYLSNIGAIKEINRATRANSSHLSRDKIVNYFGDNNEKLQATVKENFTTHSYRKAYANQQIHYYLKEIKEGRVTEIMNDLCEREDPNKIFEKLDRERERANYHYKNTDHHRDLNQPELALFFASVDMGHYRLDIMSYYINRREFITNNK